MIDLKNLESLLKSLKTEIKRTHNTLMNGLSDEEKEKVQAELNSKIDAAKEEHNSPFLNDFMKEIYGR